MKYLIAGASGLVGSNMARFLVSRGNNVIAFGRRAIEDIDILQDVKNDSNFRYFQHDVCNPLDIEKVDYVLNFASPASPKNHLLDPVGTMRSNLIGTMNLLETAHKVGAVFFHASSGEIYGDSPVVPQIEEYIGKTDPVGPRSSYVESKRASEALVTNFARQYNLNVKLVRLFNVYGPGMRVDDGRAISNFIVAALKDKSITLFGAGTQSRSLTFVKDIVMGISLLLDTGHDSLGPINLGTPHEYQIIDIAELIIRIAGSKSVINFGPMPPGEPSRLVPEITKARTLLGWEPTMPLEQGLEQTIQYYKTLI